MKKILVLSVLLVLVVFGVSAATVGTGSLNVFGLIGEGDLEFSVNQTLLVADRIDLINDADVQSTGSGVEVGNWVFDAENQAAAVDYTVTYTYDALTQGGASPDTIAYELLIDDGTSAATKVSGETTTFTATSGNYNTSRDVLVRLTAAGETAAASAAASSNYNSTVTVELSTL
ncbi:MAG: hypothetical protein PQJ47_05395 [Sphaerochaetaceae bacterium]|nr:hypothetical protein [Sphaerochaetaceae bacterium]MDC7247330.1 hypothetical protein [Sphaerochaetaceae bacterium]